MLDGWNMSLVAGILSRVNMKTARAEDGEYGHPEQNNQLGLGAL